MGTHFILVGTLSIDVIVARDCFDSFGNYGEASLPDHKDLVYSSP